MKFKTYFFNLSLTIIIFSLTKNIVCYKKDHSLLNSSEIPDSQDSPDIPEPSDIPNFQDNLDYLDSNSSDSNSLDSDSLDSDSLDSDSLDSDSLDSETWVSESSDTYSSATDFPILDSSIPDSSDSDSDYLPDINFTDYPTYSDYSYFSDYANYSEYYSDYYTEFPIIEYLPVIIYNETITNQNETINITLNRVNKTGFEEENDTLEAYIKLCINFTEIFHEIELTLDYRDNDIEILLYKSDEIEKIKNNSISPYKSGNNSLKIRTFELFDSDINLGCFYFKLIQHKVEYFNISENYTANINIMKDPYNIIDDNFNMKQHENFTFYYKKDKEIMNKNKSVILTLLSSSMKNFIFRYSIFEINEKEENSNIVTLNKTFFNGYSLIINNKLFGDDDREKYIKLELLFNDINNNELIQIKTRKYCNEGTYITVGEHLDIILKDDINEECFIFSPKDGNNNKKYFLNFLSMTKNIRVKVDPSEKNLNFPIDKESMVEEYEINKDNSICFYKTFDEFGEFGSISFEIIPTKNEDKTTDVIIDNFPIIRDLWTCHYLKPGTAALYKPEVYESNNSVAKFSIHITKGNLSLFIVDCNNSSLNNCSLKKEDFSNLKSYQDINGFISSKENIPSIYDNINALVLCDSEIDGNQNQENCMFEIEIKNENEDTYLFPDFRIHSFIVDEKPEKYIINKKDINKENLFININYFINKPKIIFEPNIIEMEEVESNQIYTMKNKLSFRIKKDKINVDYLNVTINGEKILYYGINFQINEDDNTNLIENNILYYYQPNEKITKFDFISKDKSNYEYILNINTFGNNLCLKLENGSLIRPDNDLIQIYSNNFSSFEISNDNMDEEEKSNYLFNIEYHEQTEKKKIYIEDGYLYKNRINQYIKEVDYYFIALKNDSTDRLLINFRKDSINSVNIGFFTGNIKIEETKIERELSKMIILEKNNLNCSEYNNYAEYCLYTINIKTNSINYINEDIDFSIQIIKYDSNEKPIYLPQNTFMSNLLINDHKQNYYFEIENNKASIIYVDFLEGEGSAIAEIYNDTNGAILNKIIIDYNFYNKSFNINEEKTKMCQGICKINIQIFLNYSDFLDYYSLTDDLIYKYYIYSKIETESKSDFYFNVPESEYIYGFVDNEKKTDYYKAKTVKNTKKIGFYIYCDDCIFSSGENTKNILLKDFITIELPDTDIRNIKYTIQNNNKISNQSYSVKMISYENDKKTLYIPMNSIRNAFCKIGKDNPCHFEIPKESYNNIQKIIVLVPNFENSQITLEYEETKFTNKTYIEFNTDDNKVIYKIDVTSNYEAIITFVSLHYKIISNRMKYIYPEDYSIIHFESENNMTISPLIEHGFFHYDINLVRGEGYIKALNTENEDENYNLKPIVKENLNLLFESKNNLEKKPNIQIHGENNSIFYFRLIVDYHNNNLIEMNFQKKNYFKYININNESSVWPLNFFMKLNLRTDSDNYNALNDINLNYKFWKNYDNNVFDPLLESYNADIFLVNKSFINRIKFNYNNIETKASLSNKYIYRHDLTGGYSLIEAEEILTKMKEGGNYYLFISIYYNQTYFNERYDKDINVVLTAFDFSENYFLPMNEYFMILINKYREILIGNKLEMKEDAFIEYSLKDINLTINSTINEEDKYGKKFLHLNKDENYLINFNQVGENEIETSNLLIKYNLLNGGDYSYFTLNNDIVNYNNVSIFFEPIKDYFNEDSKLYTIYNIKLFKVEDKNDFIPNTTYETNNNTYMYYKYINNSQANLSFDISTIELGYYYVSILAEARKENIYEYLLYNPLFIEKIEEDYTLNINISYNEGMFPPKYMKSVKYKAAVSIDSNPEDYIKLSLEHKNYYDKNEIYASQNDTFLNSFDLYKESDYKVVQRESSLIIPVKEINDLKSLYIRIPCNEFCDYKFYYKIYKKENISINDNECFDIKINGNSVNFNYNIKSNNNISLFTMTSYSIDNFSVKHEKTVLKKTFFNGYSYLFDHNKDNDKNNIQFTIEGNLRVKVCHRFLTDIKENIIDINNTKKIFVGDIKYSSVNSSTKDCFSIYKSLTDDNNIKKYKMSFITKTKNIEITLFNENRIKNEEPKLQNEESFDYEFDSSNVGFCISKANDKFNKASVLFQFLSVQEDEYIDQPLVMPLIKGVSTKQRLGKKQILYYRINENPNESQTINVHFQTLSGSPRIFYSECNNYPNCYFNINNINNITNNNLIEEKNFFSNNNLHFNFSISNEDFYQKSQFPAVIVYCEGDEECNYYIEMTNDFETILLNQKRKIYSFIESNNNHKYKIELPLKEDIEITSQKIYIQLHRFVGESALNVKINSLENNYYNYNDNGIIYHLNISENTRDFDIEINGSNSIYSLFYYIVNTDNTDNNIYLPSGEVHYNIIQNSEKIKYYFQDETNKKDLKYIVSINAINCYLNANNKEKNRNFQFTINKTQSISVSTNSAIRDKCEFTISASELMDNGTIKDLIFNDRTYHYFNFSDGFKTAKIDYLISKNDFENKEIFINVNKKSEENINLAYNIIEHRNSIIYDYNEMIYLPIFNYSLSENNNLYHLIITISSEKNEKGEFKIKLNGNRDKYRSYIDPEEIESGYIKNQVDYYYEFINNNNNYEQIYLDSKGLAKFENITIRNDKNFNLQIKNSNDIPKNYIDLKPYDMCNQSCKIYFSIRDNNMSKYKIYILSNKINLNIQSNINIYGNLNKNNTINSFMTKFDNNEKNILLNFNCFKCKIIIIYYDNKNRIEKNIQKSNNITIKGNELYVRVQNSTHLDNNENYYYYFSIIDKNTPIIIDQAESNICYKECKFILPLYKSYNYNSNFILFYVPETEKANISAKFISGNPNYNDLFSFNLNETSEYSSTESPITNRLFVNISNYTYDDLEVYIQIYVKSSYNSTFNFITSKFHESLYFLKESILYPQNILIVNNSSTFYQDISFNTKLAINLINGSGYISLNNDENYYLDYENQDIVYILKENQRNQVKKYISSSEEDFIFYLNIEEDNEEYDLQTQKTNYFKISQNNKKLDITFNIENKHDEDLYINYHFSKLESKDHNASNLVNYTQESFIFTLYNENNRSKPYYTYHKSLRRGYVHINKDYINKYKKITLNIKSNNTYYNYINFEVTPIYINNNNIIELPRNAYLEFKYNSQSISFSKPNKDYKFSKFEIDYQKKIRITLNNESEYQLMNYSGKYNYSINNDDSLDYNIGLKGVNGEDILIKFITSKNNITDIKKSEKIDIKPDDEKNTSIFVNHYNIDKIDKITNKSYLIRLYNVLDYDKDEDMDHIFEQINPNITFRKELNKTELNNEELNYKVEFSNLDNGEYLISILSEVYYNDNVEYFSLGYEKLYYKPNKPIKFDKSWIVVLVIVLLIFVIIVLYLIKSFIDKKKEKKNNISEDRGKFLTNKITSKI